ncbi:MAG: CBS domain-containing protein [Thermoanaerobaculales bacterium]|nr:CBS domain-containing protein [Thermoanaerobaculales bacterium]
MKVITTHLSADFDAFAAAVCAVRLYPDHRVLFPGSHEAAVRRFLADTGLPFPELKLRRARRERIEHAVVVDTSSPARLGEVWGLIERDGCPVDLIDHHAEERSDGIEADHTVFRPVGATCTIIADLYAERGIEPTEEEASLLMMGIYEDTGALSYRETTPDDLRVVARLLELGGSLGWVRRWVLKGLQPDQLALLNRIVEATEQVVVNGVPVSLAMVEVDRYHEEAAYVVHRWIETFELPVGIVMLIQPPNLNLILRSRVQGLHLGRLAQRFGGGGHATAASARIADRMPVEVREELLAGLADGLPPPATAIDVANRQIFSVDDHDTVAAAKERMNQLRLNAMPVRDPAGELVGMVTRQLLDRALGHGMGDRPVSTIMQPDLPVVPAGAPLDRLRDLFLERSYRFVVVTSRGRPAGIVTRMELFRRLFERQHAAGSPLDRRMAGERPVSQSVSRLLREQSAPWVRDLLGTAKAVADTVGIPVYLVGGMVRDLLLGRPNEDVDLVVEGSGIDFAHALAAFVDGRCHPHQPFLTAVVTLPDGHRVDVASARTEFYRTPAALPEVETSLIRQDLYRRDFTINALAVALHGDQHGTLVDFFGGRKDLQRGDIRVLHSLSFIDDPTRAIRAVRYARRLDFAIAPDTRNLIATAVAEGVFDRLSGQRLRRELENLLAEDHPASALELTAELGLLPAISSGLVWSEEVRAYLLEVEAQLAWFELERLGPPPEPWLLFLGGLALKAGPELPRRLVDRLQLTGDQARRMLELADSVAAIRAAGAAGVRASARVRAVEGRSAEAVLLAMADLGLEGGRRLAAAVEAAVRVRPPVSGRQIVDAGVDSGPWVGRALKRTRDAIVDGEIDAGDSFEYALAAAREGRTEAAP